MLCILGSDVQTRLEADRWLQPKCPADRLQNLLPYHIIQACATATVFARYDPQVMIQLLSQEENFSWCRATGYGSGQLHVSVCETVRM